MVTELKCECCGQDHTDCLITCPECRVADQRVKQHREALLALQESVIHMAYTDEGTCKECGALTDESHDPTCEFGSAEGKAMELTD